MKSVITAVAAAGMLAAGQAAADEALAKKHNCLACHTVDKKNVGPAYKDIAKKFSISEDTVKHHLTNIFDKAGVSSRLELGLFAVHHKLVDDI